MKKYSWMAVAILAVAICIALIDPHTALNLHHGVLLGMAVAPSMEDIGKLLTDVSQELGKTNDKLSKQAEEAMKEIKNLGTLSNETKTRTDELLIKQADLTGKVNALQAQLTEVEQKAARSTLGPARPLSVGQQLITADKLKNLGKVSTGMRVSVDVKMTTTSAGLIGTDGGPVVPADRQADILPRLRQRLFLRDLLSAGRTAAPIVTWVEETGFTNNAAAVSEANTKPYSDISFAAKFAPVTTIAHLFKATKQILDDFTMLQSIVDDELRYGLKLTEETEMLLGDGSGVHLHGIIPQASAFHHEFVPADITPVDDIRLAMLQTQLARLPATGIVLHFTDWARIELTKDLQGRYVLANPQGLLGPTLWGLPVVATETAAMAGKLLVGAFRGAAMIFDREDANVVISTENADDFEKNLISIRCEERLALAVKRPQAFIYGALSLAT